MNLKNLKIGQSIIARCWKGYEPVPGKKPYSEDSCRPISSDFDDEVCSAMGENEEVEAAEYQGKEVKLNKPMRGDVKKYKVYVKDPDTGNVKKVNFGDKNMEIKRDDPEARKNFRARHNCDDPGPKTKAKYWSCKFWSSKPVSELLKG